MAEWRYKTKTTAAIAQGILATVGLAMMLISLLDAPVWVSGIVLGYAAIQTAKALNK